MGVGAGVGRAHWGNYLNHQATYFSCSIYLTPKDGLFVSDRPEHSVGPLSNFVKEIFTPVSL